MTPVRVAHVVPTDRIAWLLLRVGLSRLQEAGFEVTVLCGDAGYGRQLAETGVRVVHVPFARELSPWTDLRCLAALRRELRRGGFAIAHSHNPKGTLLGPLAARLAGVPVVVHTVHGFLFNEATTGPRRWLAVAAERWCAAWCHQLLFQSSEDHALAVAHRFKRPERLHLVGNGIDERRFDPSLYPGGRDRLRAALGYCDRDRVVGMVGRFVREKGYVEFAAMARRLARRDSRARFLVVGISEPEQSDAVDPKSLFEEAGIADRCTVLEQRSDMPELYLSMDLAVLPSHREGIPRALLEAAAMGVPIAATAIRGCREVIIDGQTGVLFGLRDVDSFTATVESLLQDEDRRRRLGAAGRQHVLEHYTETRAAERLIACYRRFLGAG
jgi:glycosyltransferase involved in cell wall biosynthesis